jgi:hypothetical protein
MTPAQPASGRGANARPMEVKHMSERRSDSADDKPDGAGREPSPSIPHHSIPSEPPEPNPERGDRDPGAILKASPRAHPMYPEDRLREDETIVMFIPRRRPKRTERP